MFVSGLEVKRFKPFKLRGLGLKIFKLWLLAAPCLGLDI